MQRYTHTLVGIEMRVDVVVGEVAVLPLAHQVGQLADIVQMHFGREQQNAVVEIKALAGLDFAREFPVNDDFADRIIFSFH